MIAPAAGPRAPRCGRESGREQPRHGSAFGAWAAALDDPDLAADPRLMVPVYYDLGRRKTKVWILVGWVEEPELAPKPSGFTAAQQAAASRPPRLVVASSTDPPPRARMLSRMRLLAAVFFVALALSCAGAPERAPPPVVTLAAPSAAGSSIVEAVLATASASAAAPPPDPMPPPLDALAVAACALRAPQWRARSGAVALRLSRGGRPYGRLTSGTDATLQLAADASPDDPILDIDAGGVVLSACVDAAAFELHPARAFDVSDSLVPRASAVLTPIHATPGVLTVTLAVPGALSLAGNAVTFDRLCADVTFVEQAFEPLAALGGRGLDRAAGLPRGRSLRLSVAPGGPPALELHPASGDELGVTVLEERQGRARIAWSIGDVVAFGWTVSAALGPAPPRGPGKGAAIGLGSLSTLGGAVHCAHEVPLVVEVDGERRTIGRIAQGTHFVVGPSVDEYQQVTPVLATVRSAPDAVWMVKRTALVGCK